MIIFLKKYEKIALALIYNPNYFHYFDDDISYLFQFYKTFC